MSRTRIEVEEELSALCNLADIVPQYTAFGDDNQEAINAQIKVIRERMSFEDVLYEFEDERSYTLSAAQDALRWLRDDDEPVSAAWMELVASSAEIRAVAS